MVNLFYYIYYRLAHFYRRYNQPNPSFVAYCALCVIQILTLGLLFAIYYKIHPQTKILVWILSHKGIVILCQFGVFLMQYTKFRNIDKTLEEKWGNEPPIQRRIRKYLIILYIIVVVVVFFCIV